MPSAAISKCDHQARVHRRSNYLYEKILEWCGECVGINPIKTARFFPMTGEKDRARAIVITRSSAEKRVRSVAHGLGLRFRLLDEEMPGHPHLVLRSRGCVIFVCACQAYLHSCPAGRATEQSRLIHQSALHQRKGLDAVLSVLQRRAWKAGVIWECQAKEPAQIRKALEGICEIDLQGRPLPILDDLSRLGGPPRLRSTL